MNFNYIITFISYFLPESLKIFFTLFLDFLKIFFISFSHIIYFPLLFNFIVSLQYILPIIYPFIIFEIPRNSLRSFFVCCFFSFIFIYFFQLIPQNYTINFSLISDSLKDVIISNVKYIQVNYISDVRITPISTGTFFNSILNFISNNFTSGFSIKSLLIIIRFELLNFIGNILSLLPTSFILFMINFYVSICNCIIFIFNSSVYLLFYFILEIKKIIILFFLNPLYFNCMFFFKMGKYIFYRLFRLEP